MARTKQTYTRECWVLLADNTPVGVFTNKQTAVVERLRLSRAQAEDVESLADIATSGSTPLRFTLSDAVQLVED